MSAATAEERDSLEAKIKAREGILQPMYHQVAVHFADLHDTPEHMLEKNLIHEIIPWRKSRKLLYWRLRRRLLEEELRRHILEIQPTLGEGQVDAMLRRWFVEDKGATESYLWDQDESVVLWLLDQADNENSVVARNIHCVRRDAVVTKIKEVLDLCPEVRLDAVLEIAHRLHSSERTELQRTLAQLEASGEEPHNDSGASS